MRGLNEKQQSLNAKIVQNTVPPKGLVLVLLVVVLIGLIINVANGRSPDTHNVMALYVLGDSSVDCGDNTLLYPLTHHNFSLYPCDSSDSSLLPYLLGTTFSDLSLAYFIASFLGIICVLYSWGFEYIWMFLLELAFFKHRDNLQCLLQDYLFFSFFNPQDFLLSYLSFNSLSRIMWKICPIGRERELLHFRECVSSLEATTLLHFLEQLKFRFLINIRIE